MANSAIQLFSVVLLVLCLIVILVESDKVPTLTRETKRRAILSSGNDLWNVNLNSIGHNEVDSPEQYNQKKVESSEQPPTIVELLPFNLQKTVYLFQSQTKRLYFPLYRSKSNISFIVTPCDSSINLQLFFINSRTVKRYRKRKSNRHTRRPSIKLLAQRLWNDYRRQLLLNHTGNQRFQQTFTRSGLYIVQLASEDSTDLSAKLFLSTNGNPYPAIPPVASVLSKQIYSNGYWNKDDNDDDDRDLSTGNSTLAFSAELWWNPALNSNSQQPYQQYQYCVAVSERKHHRDNCLINKDPIDSYSQSESELNEISHILSSPSLPSSSLDQEGSSVDWWERAAKRLLRDSLYKEFNENVVHFECTNRTNAIVRGLKPDLTYYVDVFVRNQLTNTSSRYWTSNFTLSVPPEHRRQSSSTNKSNLPPKQILHDSLFTGVFLDAKNKFKKRLLYRVQNSHLDHHNKLNIFIQPCTGFGPVQLLIRQTFGAEAYFDRKKRHNNNNNNDHRHNERMLFGGSHDEESNDQGVLYFEEITETRTFEVTIPVEDSNGTIYLEFEISTANLRQSRSMVLLASSSLNRFPFPRMPNDRTIRAMETISNCNSITLAWNASPDERVLYCILQRNADLKYSSFEESRELCDRIRPINPNKRALLDNDNGEDDDDDENDDEDNDLDYGETVKFKDPTRKVICRRYKSSKRRMNNLIMQNVRRLSPDKRYVFQVVVSKSGGRSLNYEQVWAETKDAGRCSKKHNRPFLN